MINTNILHKNCSGNLVLLGNLNNINYISDKSYSVFRLFPCILVFISTTLKLFVNL